MSTVTAPIVKSITFERATCTRCGGSGEYPSAAWQGRCMGCSGTGQKLTRRGRAAYNRVLQHLEQLPTVAVTDLQAGDRVWNTGTFNARTVVAVEPSRHKVSYNGVEHQCVVLRYATGGDVIVERDHQVTVHPGVAALAEVVRRMSGATIVYREQ